MSTEDSTAAENEVATVTVGDLHVAILVGEHIDGTPYLRLAGVDCNLEGEQPGLYYATPIEPAAPTAFDPEGVIACPDCGSDDLGHFDALDRGDDSVTGVACETCGYERVVCADCGRETEYVDNDYRHVDATASCFLIRARACSPALRSIAPVVVTGASVPTQTPDPTETS